METVEYYDANNLLEEPAFKWWAKKLLKKEGRMISMVKSYYWITIHKLDIDLHQYVQEAYTIDEENGDTFWRDAIYKKLKKIWGMKTFEMTEGFKMEDIWSQKHPMPVYKEIGYHIIFDIKMIEFFTRKARLVENCHENEYVPKWDTYSSVVSRDSVRIEFLYVALNDLYILSWNISNAYIEAPCG